MVVVSVAKSVRRHVALASAFVVCLCAAPAWGQSAEPTEADRIARRQLLQEATEAQSAGRAQDALSLAQRAEQIEATAGTRLLIAQLRAQLGQYVEAMSSVELCLREVDSDRQTTARNRAAIRERCETLQREVRTHVGGLVIEVPNDAPAGLRVSVNGAELNPALYGVSRPVVAGEVVVVATLSGIAPGTQRVTVAAGAAERLRVVVPNTRVDAPVEVAPVQPPRPEPIARDVSSATSSTQRTLAFVAGGVGLATIGGAVVGGLMFQSTASDYEQQRCADVDLTASCQDQYDRLGTLNTVQWIGYLGGGALLATGVVLFVTAPRSTRSDVSWRCGLGPGTAGVSCGARF